MATNAGTRAGDEWGGGDEDPPPDLERDERGWPVLRASIGTDPCDGRNPSTGRVCVIGYHHGYHRDGSGAEWLDE